MTVTNFMKQLENEMKEDRELARLTRQEELILDVTELVLEKMENKGISKSKLAEMLGTNKSHITQLLRGSRNMTLRTVSDIFFELDCKLAVDAFTEEEDNEEGGLLESSIFNIRGLHTNWQQIAPNTGYKYSELKGEVIAA
jgi:transcriptional regulator with XRE-family HTH domain